jgi:hypothetical protein
MHRIYRALFFLLVFPLCFSHANLRANAGAKKISALLTTEDSVPPVWGQYKCVHELDGKLFSDEQINDCATRLRANPYLRDVTIHTTELADTWVVEFVLRGEALVLDEFTIETFDHKQVDILKLLSVNDKNLHVGGIYSPDAEASAYEAIRQFYRARGRLVGVVPKVRLDYKKRVAKVDFQVILGPTILADPLVPPYGDACADRMTVIDWWASDDGVPVELVQSGLALGPPFACFSEELAQRDRDYLSTMKILSSSSVEYSGSVGNRRIHYKLEAKPLKVEQINVRGFGELPSNLGTSEPNLNDSLSLKVGEVYSRAAARNTVEYLKKQFSHDGKWTDVTVDEELLSADSLRVTFSVLVFPLQTVIVDGRELQGTDHSRSPSFSRCAIQAARSNRGAVAFADRRTRCVRCWRSWPDDRGDGGRADLDRGRQSRICAAVLPA